jgi:hypothetical protein
MAFNKKSSISIIISVVANVSIFTLLPQIVGAGPIGGFYLSSIGKFIKNEGSGTAAQILDRSGKFREFLEKRGFPTRANTSSGRHSMAVWDRDTEILHYIKESKDGSVTTNTIELPASRDIILHIANDKTRGDVPGDIVVVTRESGIIEEYRTANIKDLRGNQPDTGQTRASPVLIKSSPRKSSFEDLNGGEVVVTEERISYTVAGREFFDGSNPETWITKAKVGNYRQRHPGTEVIKVTPNPANKEVTVTYSDGAIVEYHWKKRDGKMGFGDETSPGNSIKFVPVWKTYTAEVNFYPIEGTEVVRGKPVDGIGVNSAQQ